MQPKCNLIIDSCCDLPAQIIDDPGVYLLKFPFQMSDGGHMDDLYCSMSAHEFYEAMRQGESPLTAQISIPDYAAAFTWAAESGIPTVYLSFTSGLSGTFDTAQNVLDSIREKYPDAEIYLVDTKLASIAEGMVVYAAMAERTHGMTGRELAAWAEEVVNYIHSSFIVDDLSALKRGGRIPAGVAYAGTKLDVKPLLYIDTEGKLAMGGVARGRKKAIRLMMEAYKTTVTKELGHNYVVVGAADCPKDLKNLSDMLRKTDESMLVIESDIGPVIGSHVGPGMLALVWWGADRRESLSMADRIAKRVKSE